MVALSFLIRSLLVRVILITCFFSLQLALFAQEYDAELLSYETHTTVVKSKLIRNTHVQVRINNRAGEKYATVSIPYSKSDRISNIEAFIQDQHGQVVRRLKKGDISEKSNISSSSLYEDDYIKEFTLKHNSYPYTITYSFQIQQDEFIYVDYWVPVLSRKIPTLHSSLTVSVPQDFKLSYASNLTKEFHIDTTESMIQYTWKADYADPIKDEKLAPPLSVYLPMVKIVPVDFSYELDGSFETWTGFGNWEIELLKGIQDLPESEERKIASIVKGIDDDREKIKALYHYLQDNTRYINVSIETGGLKPYPASYVAENKYGDCKALSNYFITVLQTIGIRAYYTNVYAGEPIRPINKLFPSQQFNHVILFIPREHDTIWLDCTNNLAFNYLGTFTQNREAFVIAENRSNFIRTPALTNEDVLESRRIRVPYDRYAKITVEFKNTYRGNMYELLSELDRTVNLNDKSRILRNYLIEDGFELIDYSIQKPKRDSAFIQLHYSANTDQIYHHYGKDILVQNIPLQLPEFEEPDDRTLPVQIDCPIYKIDTITYEIPQGYGLSEPVANQYVSDGPGEYSMKFSKQEDHIQVVKELKVQPGFYPKSDYQEIYSFFSKVKMIENKIFITLTKN